MYLNFKWMRGQFYSSEEPNPTANSISKAWVNSSTVAVGHLNNPCADIAPLFYTTWTMIYQPFTIKQDGRLATLISIYKLQEAATLFKKFSTFQPPQRMYCTAPLKIMRTTLPAQYVLKNYSENNELCGHGTWSFLIEEILNVDNKILVICVRVCATLS